MTAESYDEAANRVDFGRSVVHKDPDIHRMAATIAAVTRIVISMQATANAIPIAHTRDE
jgi:hypothetical protein